MGTIITSICDVLLDLVPSVEFKKREKYPWRSVASFLFIYRKDVVKK